MPGQSSNKLRFRLSHFLSRSTGSKRSGPRDHRPRTPPQAGARCTPRLDRDPARSLHRLREDLHLPSAAFSTSNSVEPILATTHTNTNGRFAPVPPAIRKEWEWPFLSRTCEQPARFEAWVISHPPPQLTGVGWRDCCEDGPVALIKPACARDDALVLDQTATWQWNSHFGSSVENQADVLQPGV